MIPVLLFLSLILSDFTTTADSTVSPLVAQGCAECVPKQVSVDLVFVIDNSVNTGQDGLNQIQNFIKTNFAQYNIQTLGSTDPFHMRVGVYAYSDKGYPIKPLGTITAADLANLKIPYNAGTLNTNLVDALSAVESNEFFGPGHRVNAAKVIVIMGSTFVPGSYRDPTSESSSFIGLGGKIIVYELYKPGSNGFVLENLTNSVYYVNSSSPDAGERMQKSICTASRVCPAGSTSYKSDPNSLAPLAGCYTYMSFMANFASASNNCQSLGGTIAEAQTSDKASFLQNLFRKQYVWNGLKWDSIHNGWVWVDGKPLDNSNALWATNGNHVNGQDCTTLLPDGKWQQNDCRNGYFISCQLPPCDTQRAC